MEQSFREILREQDRLRHRLQAANDTFFDQIELILTDDQLPRMQRVRLAHDRLNYRHSKRPPRERHVDIVKMIEEMQLPPEDRQAVEKMLIDFEPVFVQALREAAEADQRAGVYQFAILDRDPGGRFQPDPQTQNEVDALQEKGERIRLRSSRRLVEVIRNGLQRSKEVLSPDLARELQNRYDESAYPEVYPDPALALDLYENAVTLDFLTEEQLSVINSFRDEYVRAHESLSKRIARTLYDHSYLYFQYNAEATAKLGKRTGEVAPLVLKREELNLAQPGRIRSVLLPEQSEQLKPWRYEKAQPPRPWAQLAGLPRDPKPRELPPRPPGLVKPAAPPPPDDKQ